jgi:hypothetical protein
MGIAPGLDIDTFPAGGRKVVGKRLGHLSHRDSNARYAKIVAGATATAKQTSARDLCLLIVRMACSVRGDSYTSDTT